MVKVHAPPLRRWYRTDFRVPDRAGQPHSPVAAGSLLVPELALLAEASDVGRVDVTAVHTVNTVVERIAVGVGARPLHTSPITRYQLSR